MSAALPEIWLSLRSDGIDGTGAETDPRDASTATKFATVMASIGSGYTVRLTPGTFETYGGIAMVNRRPIVGSGIGMTTVKLADNAAVASGSQVTVFSASGTNMDYASVRELTIDLNPDGQPIYKGDLPGDLSAIYLNARHATIENVRVLGPYKGAEESDPEGFPVVIGCDAVSSASNPHYGRIRGLILENASGYATLISIGYPGTAASNWPMHQGTAIFENCVVLNCTGRNACFGYGGWCHALISGNYVNGAHAILNQDTYVARNVTIENNVGENIRAFGFNLGAADGGYDQNIVIRGNTVKAAAGSFPGLCSLACPSPSSQALIEGNLLDCSLTDLTAFPYYAPLAVNFGEGAIVRGNRFSKQAGMAFNSRVNQPGAQIYDNSYDDGTPIYDASLSSMIQGRWRKEITLAPTQQGIIILGEFDLYDAKSFEIAMGATGANYGGNATTFRLNARSFTEMILKREASLAFAPDFWEVCKKDLGSGVTMLAVRMNSAYVSATNGGTMAFSFVGTPLRGSAGSSSGMTVITPS